MKQKLGRRLSALVVAAAMSVLILPATALADYDNGVTTQVDGTTYVASITVTDDESNSTTYYYTILARAVADAQSGDTVTLLSDVTITSQIFVDGKSITLDLGSYSISAGTDFAGYLLNVGNSTAATLTVTGDGTISGTYGIKVNGGSTLVVNSGTITGTSAGIVQYTDSTVTITGGTISGILKYDGTTTITGGTFGDDVSSYLTSEYVVLVDDGTYTVMTATDAQASDATVVATTTADDATYYYYYVSADAIDGPTISQYKVTFVYGSDEGTTTYVWVIAGEKVAETDVPDATVDGYTFNGWSYVNADSEDVTGATADAIAELPITSAMTFTAAYTVIEEEVTEEVEEETEETIASTGDDTNVLVFGSIALLAAAGAVVARKKLYVK